MDDNTDSARPSSEPGCQEDGISIQMSKLAFDVDCTRESPRSDIDFKQNSARCCCGLHLGLLDILSLNKKLRMVLRNRTPPFRKPLLSFSKIGYPWMHVKINDFIVEKGEC